MKKPPLILNATAASLLGFLSKSSMAGWDLTVAVEGSIGYFWNVTRSQIYRELNHLNANGLVRQGKTGPREKKSFSITQEGRRAFRRWMTREPSEELIRFPLLLTVFFAEEVDTEKLKEFLSIHRLRHQRRLEVYRELLNSKEPKVQGGPLQTILFGIQYEEMVLRWFEQLPWLRG